MVDGLKVEIGLSVFSFKTLCLVQDAFWMSTQASGETEGLSMAEANLKRSLKTSWCVGRWSSLLVFLGWPDTSRKLTTDIKLAKLLDPRPLQEQRCGAYCVL